MRAYNYWLSGSRVLEIEFDKDGALAVTKFPPHGAYDYVPNYASGDRLESRDTVITGSEDPAVNYRGDAWTVVQNKSYYQGQAQVTTEANQEIEYAFRGDEIYWRAVFGPDAGQADVYLDGQFQQTVDLHFAEVENPYEFAFIRTDLDPEVPHTIKIVTRSGTVRHIAFERSRLPED